MPMIKWEDIPNQFKSELSEAKSSGILEGGRRKIGTGPAVFSPQYPAIELSTAECGDWRVEFPSDMYRFRDAGGGPFDFGHGNGFESVDMAHRPDQPVLIKLAHADEGKGSSIPAVVMASNPGVLILNELAFQILLQVEPLGEDRILEAEVTLEGYSMLGPYFIVDPMCSDDIVDLKNSKISWGLNISNEWAYSCLKTTTAFRVDSDFHLKRYFGGFRIAVSKDLLYTWHRHDVGLPGEYFDPHGLGDRQTYRPRLLVPLRN